MSLVARSGFDFFTAKARDNIQLTKSAILQTLILACERHLQKDKFWFSPKGFQREISLKMRSYDEGDQELVLQPYYLKCINSFGILVDFHFKLKEGVPFSRRVQQLSLALDHGGRRNLNNYLDRGNIIETFLKESSAVFEDLRFLGDQALIRFSNTYTPLPANRLRSRIYVMGGNHESRGQFAGLRDYGPLEVSPHSPNLVFVFRESERLRARDLATALRGDNPRARANFFGFEKLFRTPITIDRAPIVLNDFSRGEMDRTVQELNSRPGTNLPILVMPHDEEAYLTHKSVFTHAGISSQVCTLEMLADETTFKWSVGNVALQIFCKALGQPWKVRPTNTNSLIIGISQSHKTSKSEAGHFTVSKYFAFSVQTDSSGVFQRIQVLSEADNETSYIEGLKSSLQEIISRARAEFSRVVIHTSFKLRNREIDAIHEVVRSAADNQSVQKCKFAVVKVNHANRYFAFNRSVNSLVPYEGSYLRLGGGEYLIWFEGIFPDKQTVTKAYPGPTHLQFLRLNEDSAIEDQILLQDLINLSGANWRGFNAKSTPVSVFYCHLVADLVHDFQVRGLPLPSVEDLRPWFL